MTRKASTALRDRRFSGDSVVRTWWWLRSPGNNDDNAANVNNDGNLNMNGNHVSNAEGGVRPALPYCLIFVRKFGESVRGKVKESDSFLPDGWKNTDWREFGRDFIFKLYGRGAG